MKKIFFKHIIALCVFISGTDFIFAQPDNPNLDQIPQQYLDYLSTVQTKPFSVVTDNTGYDNFDIGTAFAEVHTVMNPRNPLQSMAAWNTTAGANLYYTNNGIDWALAPQPAWGQSMRGDPVLAYDSLGNGFFDNMYGASILGTITARTSNNGQSWNGVAFANIGNDKNWIAADQTGGPYANSIYGVMTPGNFVRSNNNGVSFSSTFSSTNQLPGMMVCVGPNGNISGGCVYFVTNVGSSFAPTWTFYKSTDGGATFTLASQVVYANYVGTNVGGRNSVENMRTRPYPFITADNSYGPHRGRLYLVYASNFPVGDGYKPNIYCRYSDNQGSTWSSESIINDDPNTQNNHQFMPAPWCDKETGRLTVHWMDTRDCPTSDSALIYASYSNDGVTFAPNSQISNKKFKINCVSCGGGGTPAYLGDYNSTTSNAVTSVLAWTDFRTSSFANYVAYYPDYALKTSTSAINVNSGGNATFKVVVPSVKAYSRSVKFTLSMDTLPTSGTLNLSFVGKDSVNSYPDSVTVKVDAVGTVTPGRYSLKIIARGPNGTPAHRRYVNVLVNTSSLTIGTNRNGVADYKVNGITYNTTQELYFTNGTPVTIQAVSPRTVGSTRYVYANWSNGGDTTQTINISSNLNLTAFYKVQYRLTVSTPQGTAFGGNTFYDSASNATFGVPLRIVNNGGTDYYFRGWTGTGGTGNYSSADSTGRDSVVTIPILGIYVETARWTTTSEINLLSTAVPMSYSLYQNYPNPFNPTTNIKFDIVKNGNVKVIVYDALGKTVSTLIDNSLQPGSYEVNFNAADLSSGIYYYRIITNDFNNVKKMLLIK